MTYIDTGKGKSEKKADFFGKLACGLLGGRYSGIVDGAIVFQGGFFVAVVFLWLLAWRVFFLTIID